MLARAQQLSLARIANRAPSPHNTQPARWRFEGARIALYEVASRRLAVADPTGRDHAIALGAAWEGMCIALSRLGMGLEPPRAESSPPSTPLRRVCAAAICNVAAPDPLFAAILRRRSYRGCFPAADIAASAGLAALAANWPAVRWIDSARLARIARWHAEAAAAAIADADFVRELHSWIRFSRKDPGWRRDGLSAACLGLDRMQSLGARVLLRPAVAGLLARAGLARRLLAECRETCSAMAVALFHAPFGEAPFQTGRTFYRFWLSMTAAGLAAVPMSALVDSPLHADRVAHEYHGSPSLTLASVLRVGPLPASAAPRSARLPAAELLV